MMQLKPLERRLLGVLVEKAKTTPDAYPLSVNALATGSNQKSNRDPIMQVDDVEVEETLDGLRESGLVTQITGGRVDRWRHNLYEVWQVDKVELAILAELLLRGAQTEGELRSRAGRMEPIDSLDALRERLQKLVQRDMVVYFGEPGRRGVQLTHAFYEAGEMERIKKQAAGAGAALPPTAPAPAVKSESDGEIREKVNQVSQRLERLESVVDELRDELSRLKASLGEA